MVLLGSFRDYGDFKVDTLYRVHIPTSTYKPHACFVCKSLTGFGISHRIDVYTKSGARIYYMFLNAPNASRKELHEKANNLLAMLKAAQ